jgi:hypothetical protein
VRGRAWRFPACVRARTSTLTPLLPFSLPPFSVLYADTSLCHPWSAGPAAWLAAYGLGVRPQLARSPLGRVLVAPHVSLAAAADADADGAALLEGAVPVAGGGAVRVRVTAGAVDVALPRGTAGTLVLTRALLARAGAAELALSASSLACTIAVDGGAPRAARLLLADAAADARLAAAGYVAPLEDEGAWARAPVATLGLADGARVVVTFAAVDGARAARARARAALAAAPFAPFPPAAWRAAFLGADALTSGDWVGTYGALGGVLFGSADATGTADYAFLPSWVTAVKPTFAFMRGAWAPGNSRDGRLPVDPRNATGARAAGYITDHMGGDPTFAIDVALGAGAPPSFLVSVYTVDWDSRGRRGTLALLDGVTLDPLSPIVQVDEYQRGVWLQWELSGPFRVRVSQTRGDNAVVNAMLFDAA